MSVEGEELAEHAILLLDLARFSRINEHIGPLAGDELIITVARRLKSSLRGGDILARSGGDEFAISSRIAGGQAAVREMARRLDRKSVVSGKSVYVRVDPGGRRIFKQKKEKRI